jgi:uncharacterized cupin superfamily protein
MWGKFRKWRGIKGRPTAIRQERLENEANEGVAQGVWRCKRGERDRRDVRGMGRGDWR